MVYRSEPGEERFSTSQVLSMSSIVPTTQVSKSSGDPEIQPVEKPSHEGISTDSPGP